MINGDKCIFFTLSSCCPKSNFCHCRVSEREWEIAFVETLFHYTHTHKDHSGMCEDCIVHFEHHVHLFKRPCEVRLQARQRLS